MKIIIGTVAGVVAAMALLVAWISFTSAQKARSTLDALASTQRKLESEMTAAQGRLAGATHDEAELRVALQQVQVAAEKPPARVQKSAPAAPPARPDLSALMEANP